MVLLAACDVSEPPDRSGPVHAAADQTPTPADSLSRTADEAAEGPTLLVLGDSLSAAYNMPVHQGWVDLLVERLGERDMRLNVVNASISGDTTAGAMVRLPALLRRYQPELVMIELGGNDGLRGLAPEQMQANLEDMIEASAAADADVILVAVKIPLNYGPQYRREFEQVYENLALRHDLPILPFPLEQIVTEPGYLQADGVHPTAAAQPLILDTFWPGIEAAYRENRIEK